MSIFKEYGNMNSIQLFYNFCYVVFKVLKVFLKYTIAWGNPYTLHVPTPPQLSLWPHPPPLAFPRASNSLLLSILISLWPQENLCANYYCNPFSVFGGTILKLDKKYVFAVRITNPAEFLKIHSKWASMICYQVSL